jgi:hypothetical protein
MVVSEQMQEGVLDISNRCQMSVMWQPVMQHDFITTAECVKSITVVWTGRTWYLVLQ